ncbi:hypothetical protein REPUB_Repub20aG0070400 [Reevesia pubescens]
MVDTDAEMETGALSYRDMLAENGVVSDGTCSYWEDNEEDSIHFEDVISDDEMDGNDDQCPKVVFSKEEKERLRKPWRKTLIVKLLSKVLGFQTLNARIKNPWQLEEGRFKVVDLGGYYLTVRQWTQNFDPLLDKIEKVIAWVRLLGLPLEYYNGLSLTRIRNIIGRVIRFDRNIEEVIRGRFARLICVELD